MKYTGKAHTVGDHIDTDAIIPARFLVTTDQDALGANCMEGLEPGWIKKTRPGDIIVAGKNFGCGSSREHAPIAILGAKIPVVVAHSFARIFYRNGFNMGLVLLEVGDQVAKIADDQTLDIDAGVGTITIRETGEMLRCQPVPAFMQKILDQGGLVPYVRKRLEAEGQAC